MAAFHVVEHFEKPISLCACEWLLVYSVFREADFGVYIQVVTVPVYIVDFAKV